MKSHSPLLDPNRFILRPLTVSLLALLGSLALPASGVAAEKPVKVFILAGQSNMEGKGQIALLERQIKAPGTHDLFARFQKDGKWVERDDVWIKFLNRKGNLTVGYGSPGRIGPELEFGWVVGDHYDAQVLLIKPAWGGKSLFRDFRPPSSGLPPAADLEKELEQARKRTPNATLEEVKARYGAFYRQMLDEISNTLGNLKALFPSYQGQGYELTGFVWFQGWNDMINPEYTAAYATNMANFIRDVRRDLKAPNLPFVIGQLGVDGPDNRKDLRPNPKKVAFKAAQAAPAKLPEFKGNVAVVKTDAFWDMTADAVFRKGWREHQKEWDQVGSDYPYHYLGSVKTYVAIGGAFAKAVIQLDQHRQSGEGSAR